MSANIATWARVLLTLADGPLTVQEISARTSVTTWTVWYHLDLAVHRGHAERVGVRRSSTARTGRGSDLYSVTAEGLAAAAVAPPPVTRAPRATEGIICDLLDSLQHQTMAVWELAEDTGICKDQIARTIALLADLGWVVCVGIAAPSPRRGQRPKLWRITAAGLAHLAATTSAPVFPPRARAADGMAGASSRVLS